MNDYKINRYPDGSSFVKINNRKTFPGMQYYDKYIFKINTYEGLWHLNQLVDACNNKGVVPTILVPNLLDAQADRRFNEDESSGLKLVCEFLNRMNANFKIFHPHNPEVVEALINNVEIIDNFDYINKVLIKLNLTTDIGGEYSQHHIINSDKIILMAADAGGMKPLGKLSEKLNFYGEVMNCSKVRSGGKVSRQQAPIEDFEGKDILIIDDISVRGGTFKGLSKLLRERNCGKLYLAVSHMTLKNLGEDPVTDYFDKVFTTNSKFDEYHCYEDSSNPLAGSYQPENLEIIKLF